MTGFTALRPELLFLLLLGPALVAAWRRWPPPLSAARRRVALALRLTVLVLLVCALADVHVARRPDRRAVVAVVDLSDSALASKEQAAAAVTALIEAKGGDDLFGIVTFGRDAQVEMPPTRTPGFTGFQTTPEATYSDLGGALTLAGNLIPDGYSRQVVLLSDGRQNLGDAVAAVGQLRKRSVRVDVLPLGAPPGAEALVLALEAPHVLRAGQSMTVTARFRSAEPAKAKVTLLLDDGVAEERAVDLPAGVSEQTFDLAPVEPGTHKLAVLLDARPDTYSQNNAVEAVVKVLGRPKVLVLEGDAGDGANTTAALRAAGMDVETRRAKETPTDLAILARYDSFVVANAPAEAYPAGALAALATAVGDLGRGLVATGGINSYGPGGWKDTPLEEVLPVRMEVQRPREKPATAIVLAIDNLDGYFPGVILGAAQAVVDQLGPDDELGIINMRGSVPRVEIPLGRVTDRDALKRKLETIQFGDPLSYDPSIAQGIDSLAASGAATKHLIVMSDGDAGFEVGFVSADSWENLPAVRDFDMTHPDHGPLLAGARAKGVTVSSVGINVHKAANLMAHMRSIAHAGGGAYFQSDSENGVPEFLLSEARTILRPEYEQTPFFPEITSAGDLLEGVPLDAFPQLGGYVATTAKPSGEVLLVSPKGDPVLAAGHHGLGRSVAWTSDTRGRWTEGFLRSPVSSTLLGRMVAWSLPTDGPEPIRLDATARGDGLEVTVSGAARSGELQLQVISPGGVTSTHQLSPSAPGTWDGHVPTTDVGIHVLHAVVKRDGVAVGQSELAVPVPYPPEYLELERDDALLRHLAGQGGSLLTEAGAAWDQPSLPIKVTTGLFWPCLLLAALLWPFDVAVRRLTLSPVRIVALARAEAAKRRLARQREATSRRSASHAGASAIRPGQTPEPSPGRAGVESTAGRARDTDESTTPQEAVRQGPNAPEPDEPKTLAARLLDTRRRAAD